MILVYAAGYTSQLSGALIKVCGKAVVVTPLAMPAPKLKVATVVIQALEAQVGGLYHLQIFISQLEPQLGSSVKVLLLSPLHTLQEATGEEDHGHEQDDGAADDRGDHSHPEAEGLMSCHRLAQRDP